MTRRLSVRLVLGGIAAIVIIAAGALALTRSDHPLDLRPRAPSQRPALMLITTLPILFPEEFTLQSSGSKTLGALETRYKVLPIGTTDARSLSQARLLLMAHPLAQPAENLVALDQWVRGGGRLLLLADPRLDWPSKRPLGALLRPPPSFADTGLLAHWGLQLEAPKEAGPVLLGGGHNPVVYISPGRMISTNRDCDLSRADIIAECRMGKGKVAVVADADFLNAEMAERNGSTVENQLRELLELLGNLER
jgi:hypothetical protein